MYLFLKPMDTTEYNLVFILTIRLDTTWGDVRHFLNCLIEDISYL